jgi:hypothetical protein
MEVEAILKMIMMAIITSCLWVRVTYDHTILREWNIATIAVTLPMAGTILIEKFQHFPHLDSIFFQIEQSLWCQQNFHWPNRNNLLLKRIFLLVAVAVAVADFGEIKCLRPHLREIRIEVIYRAVLRGREVCGGGGGGGVGIHVSNSTRRKRRFNPQRGGGSSREVPLT